jgi:lipopolysaccharide export system permease protein
VQAAAFDPEAQTLQQPTFLHRDDVGRAIRRVWADSARWDANAGGWQLTNGVSASTDATKEGVGLRQPESFEPSTLGPQRLIIRRRGEFAGMMSTPTLLGLAAEATRDDAAPLRRSLTARVAMPLVNVLCVLIAVPFFIDRLPGSLLTRAVLCCGIVLPLYMFAAGVQMVALPGLGPIAGVLLPLVVLAPLALWRIGSLRT